jgi:hypothetical protein
MRIPNKVFGMKNRELLFRGFYKKLDGGAFLDASYNILDDRMPEREDVKRMTSEFGMLLKPAEGSNGEETEIWRLFRLHMNIGGLVATQVRLTIMGRGEGGGGGEAKGN